MAWFKPIIESQGHFAEEHDHDESGYWCMVCERFLYADECGVIVHDDKPHPADMETDSPHHSD